MTSRTRSVALLAVAAVALPLMAGCAGNSEPTGEPSGSAAPADLVTVKVGMPINANGLAGMLAMEKYAEEEGIVIEMVEVNSGAEAVPMLLNGDLDITLGDGIGTITASSNGVPLAIFGISTEAPEDPDLDPTAIAAADDSYSLTELNGASIAVSQLGGAAQLGTMAAIDEAGGDSSAVEFVELDPAQAVPALQSGQVKVAQLTEPWSSSAEKAGLPIISRPAAEGTPGMPATLWITSLEYGAQNPDALARFAAAVQKANDEINGDPDAAREFAKTVLTVDPAVIDAIRFPYFSADVVDTAGVREYVELANSYGVFAKQPDLDKLLSVQVGG